MDAVLSTLLILVVAVLAATTSFTTESRVLTVFLLLVISLVYNYRRSVCIIAVTLPRDLKFLWRYLIGIVRLKKWQFNKMTVAKLFTKQAISKPNDPCFIVVGDRTWTYGEMAAKSNQVSLVMQDHLKLKRREVVCLMMTNSAEYVWTWLGLAKLGAISALLNTNLRRKPLLHCIQVANAKAIIFSQNFLDAILEIRDQLPPDMKLFQMYGKCPSNVIDLEAEINKQPPEYPLVKGRLGFNDVLFYIYTSGTTGMPKAAVLLNSKYLLIVLATVHMLGLRSDDILYNPLPLYHTAGGLVGTGPAIVDGIATVLRGKFSASNYWTDCIKYQCTAAQYIGEMCRYLLAQPPRESDTQHCVRFMVGNGMRPAIWQQILDRFKVSQINEVYGATEGNANIINVDNTVGAVGFLPKLMPEKLLPIAVVRADEHGALIRNEDGYCIRCKPNEPGMFIGMITKGNASREFHGYIDKEDSDKKVEWNVFSTGDAAFVTGDILVADERGYLYFKDRTGDTYRWKGENVATAEVEDAISTPLDQRACVVYGVSIPNTEGRAGMAAIADPERTLDLKKLAEDLDTTLPSYARPIFLRFPKNIEMTSTFKLTKLQYQKEGFDPDIIQEPLYFRPHRGNYEPITREVFTDICNGKIKL